MLLVLVCTAAVSADLLLAQKKSVQKNVPAPSPAAGATKEQDIARASTRSNAVVENEKSNDMSQDPAVFDPIPKMSRDEFVKRLNLLLDYRRTERWDALYDLISNQFIRGRSRERFVEDYTNHPGVVGKNTKLINFSPKEVTPDSYVSGGFIVSGCAQLSGLRFPVDALVLAARENNDWRFSDIAMLVPRDTAFKPCGYLSQSAGNLKPKARP